MTIAPKIDDLTMTVAKKISDRLGEKWIPNIYAGKIRPLRTRSYEFDIPQKENRVSIQHTLLGIELQVGRRRLACPDLSTARYLRVFARIGCEEIAIPYDISLIPGLADELESSWQKTMLVLREAAKGKTQASEVRIRSLVVGAMRDEIKKTGAGEKMPLFNTRTRQRE